MLGDPQTGEKQYQKKFSHCYEGSEPHVKLHWQGSSQVTRNPQEIWLWRGRIWLQDLHRTGANRDSIHRAQTKPCVQQDPGEREQWPHGWLNQTYQLGLESFLLRYGLAVAHCWDRDIWSSSSRRCPLARVFLEVTICYHRACRFLAYITSGQTTSKREHRLIHQKTTGSKCNSTALPITARLSFSHHNSSHQFLPQQPEGRQKKKE